MNTDEKYWQKRCEFWCENYLELAQATKDLLIQADRVDDYSELKFEVFKVKKILERDARNFGRGSA
jgi:hypothetical protein